MLVMISSRDLHFLKTMYEDLKLFDEEDGLHIKYLKEEDVIEVGNGYNCVFLIVKERYDDEEKVKLLPTVFVKTVLDFLDGSPGILRLGKDQFEVYKKLV